MERYRAWLLAAAGLGILAARPALADAIDGHWCHPDGRRMEINGPTIVTPAGTRTTGHYGRHDFNYAVPAGDPGAGTKIDMILMGEMAVRVRAGNGPEETWNRCAPPTS